MSTFYIENNDALGARIKNGLKLDRAETAEFSVFVVCYSAFSGI